MFSLGLETRNLQINALRAFDIHWEKLELLYLCTTNLSLNQIPGDLKWFFKHTVWRKFSYFKFFTLCFTFESIHLKKKKKTLLLARIVQAHLGWMMSAQPFSALPRDAFMLQVSFEM